MARNIELLTKVRDLVIKTPDRLEMGSWGTVAEDLVEFDDGHKAKVSCGTTACVAGWAVQLHGYKFIVDAENRELDGAYFVTDCVAGNGRVMDIDEKARKLLGLTPEEADFLFLDVGNDEVVDVLNDFIAGKTLAEITGYDPDEYND